MRRCKGVLLTTLLVCAWVGAAGAGDIAGRVILGLDGMQLADIGPTVVYLERAAGGGTHLRERETPTIRQRDARFDPEFLVVTAGEGVLMPNDDTIFHNVFSFSRPNDFDLGVYPAGDSKTVVFEHAGLVKLYCSIHESMSGAVLVSPTSWFSTVSRGGNYRIAGVPPGDYTLTVWNEKLPAHARSLQVTRDRIQQVDVELGAITAAGSSGSAIR